MNRPPDSELDRLVDALANGRGVDWDREMSATPRLDRTIRRLREIESIAAAYQAPAAPDEPVLFVWNGLEAREWLGGGSSGDVYRAYDPRLDRDVALKLIPLPGADDAGDYLDEARKLARVRHRNVVTIHHVDREGDQVGLVCEMIDGRTLEEHLVRQGPLAGAEASLVGIELCGALAAVHAAGLVHGDVKTANVMRNREGAAILLDFGSGHRRADRSSEPSVSGTPLTLAPEALFEGKFSPSSDLYALGVLLYRLVTGAYPVPATSWDELVERHRRGGSVPLRDLRSDLDLPFVQAVEKALERDPARRFASAGEMEKALAATLPRTGAEAATPTSPAGATPGTKRPSILRVALATLAVILTAFVVTVVLARWSATNRRGAMAVEPPKEVAPDVEAPRVDALRPLELDATLFRSNAAGPERVESGAPVREGQPFFLEVSPKEAAHVYVLNEDEAGALYLLFPLPGFDTQNPLAAGVAHRLPGRRNGSSQDWELSSAGGRETILVIASRAGLPDLESRLSAFPVPVGAAAAELTPDFVEGLRGFGRTTAARAPESGPGGRLSALARELAARSPGEGIWIREITLNGQEKAGH